MKNNMTKKEKIAFIIIDIMFLISLVLYVLSSNKIINNSTFELIMRIVFPVAGVGFLVFSVVLLVVSIRRKNK